MSTEYDASGIAARAMSNKAAVTSASTIPPWLICIDMETTGLDKKLHGLLSIGAYHPASRAQFYVECAPWEGCVVDECAMRVNGQDIVEARARSVQQHHAVEMLSDWLMKVIAAMNLNPRRFVLVGKNPGFDREWLTCRDAGGVLERLIMRRMIDVHAVALAVAAARGAYVPALKINEVYVALGLPVEPEPHNAFRGAKFAWLALERLGVVSGVMQPRMDADERG